MALNENNIKEDITINNIVGKYGLNSPTVLIIGTTSIGTNSPVITLVKSDGHYSMESKSFNRATISVPDGHYKAFAGRDKSVNTNSVITFNGTNQITLVKNSAEFGSVEFDVTGNTFNIVVTQYMPIFIMIFKVS